MSYAYNQRKKHKNKNSTKIATTFEEFCIQKNKTNFNLLPQNEYEELIQEWGSYKTFHKVK